MAKRTMNKALRIWRPIAIAMTLALLAGCGDKTDDRPPLANARIGGTFVLTDQNGRPFSSQMLRGRYPIIYFGYTFCPDVCPADLQMIGAGLRAFEKSDPQRAAKVLPVFITVDPERDTPAQIGRYVAAFHPRMIGLTGSPEQIGAVAVNYGVFFQRQPVVEGETGYRVDHSRQAVLFGPDGKPIALLPADAGPAGIATILAQWVK